MRKRVLFITLLAVSCSSDKDKAIQAELASLRNCGQMINSGIRPIAGSRDQRFLGKVEESTAGCRGGDFATQFRATPWVDWSNYWGAGAAKSKAPAKDLASGPRPALRTESMASTRGLVRGRRLPPWRITWSSVVGSWASPPHTS